MHECGAPVFLSIGTQFPFFDFCFFIKIYPAGWDPLDKTSEDKEVPAYTKIIEKSTLEGMRIGVPKEFFFDHLYPEVQDLFYDFIETLRSNRSIVYDLDLHSTKV